MKHIAHIFVAVLYCLTSTASAAPADQAQAAYKNGDFEKSSKLASVLAEKGDAEAQALLGLQYKTGEGIEQNDRLAVRWSRAAAEQGSPAGQLTLATLYAQGSGVPHDMVIAYMWLELSAAQGNQEAVSARNVARQRMAAGDVKLGEDLARKCSAGLYRNCDKSER